MIKWIIKYILYGFKLDYHLSKSNKFNNVEHPIVFKYHYEKSKYYYEKMYGEKK
jgi:hypothetical protein